MDKLTRLVSAKKKINAKIKEEKKARGNWFSRWKNNQELKMYHRLQLKFGENNSSQDIEAVIDKQLDRVEGILDKAIKEQQCSPQDSH